MLMEQMLAIALITGNACLGGYHKSRGIDKSIDWEQLTHMTLARTKAKLSWQQIGAMTTKYDVLVFSANIDVMCV